jgi:serine/threonine-protein kinase
VAAIPDHLGKYRITGVLGEGAMGVVYRGFDPDIRREVALKTMRAAADSPSDTGVSAGARFRNEAQAAGRLRHPGIVGVYDYGRDGDVHFIAMEYVRGHTLSRYLAQARSGQLDIDDNDVASIVGQLLEALHHAHEQGVWHRDVKPSNMLLTQEGKVKVSDFGIARIESAELTQMTTLIGTPMYMAPEQFQGKPIDRRVDLYGSGVVLYQMLTGHTPFAGPVETMMYKAVHEAPVLPSQLDGLQRLAPYDEVVARALAKNPADRYDDALQFRDALNAAIGRLHPDAVSSATITALLPQRPGTGSERGTTSNVASAFDDATLAAAATALVRHVGPMAQVMVRRAARDCPDLPALYARLAEQLSDPAARSAFNRQTLVALAGTGTSIGTGSGTSSSATSRIGAPVAGATGPLPGARTGTTASTGTLSGGAPPSATMIDAAQRLLAQQLGPIAQVLVKKALAAAPLRDAFIDRLASALDDPAARQRLIDALRRLPR